MSSADEAVSDWLSMEDAQKLIRGRRGRVNLGVLRRWTHPGLGCRPLGDAGPRIVLRAEKVGGRLWTTLAWVREFEAARSAAAQRPAFEADVSPRRREAAYRRAEKRLDEAGIGGKKTA
jgi:hypothetical protein